MAEHNISRLLQEMVDISIRNSFRNIYTIKIVQIELDVFIYVGRNIHTYTVTIQEKEAMNSERAKGLHMMKGKGNV